MRGLGKKLGFAKVAAGVVALLLVVSVFGCGGKDTDGASKAEGTKSDAIEETETAPVQPAPEPETAPAPEPAPASAEKTTTDTSLEDAAAALANVADKFSGAADTLSDAAGTVADAADTVVDAAVSPGFKQEVDTYEAFFNDYVDFMKKVEQGATSPEIIAQTSELIQKEAEYMAAFQQIQSRDLSSADLAYYLAANARILALLQTV